MTQDPLMGHRWTRILIALGVGGFLVALATSAALVPELRLLHCLQFLIYGATLVLTLRNNPLGFGAGVFISFSWNFISLFVSHLFQVGARQFWLFLHTGHISEPVPFVVMFGGVAHFILIVGCLAGFLYLRPTLRQSAQFIGGGVLALAYFGLIISTTAPH